MIRLGVVRLAMIRLAAFMLAVLWPASPKALAQEAGEDAEGSGRRPAQHFEILRATSEIDIDGRLDETGWADALQISLDYQWFPTDNTAPPVETSCSLTYDTSNLYVGCRASDPDPSAIRAHIADRDTPFQDDHILILLDTFNDQRRAFQFRINPYGVQMDALLGVGFEDFSWDEIWDSKGRITDEGYVVEAAIPFKSLSFPDADEGPQTWGVILERSYPRSVRHRIENIEQDLSNSCILCQSDKVTGFEGISAGSDLEINPTLTSIRTDRRNELTDEGLETGSVEWEPGLTARWGLTSNLSLDGTVNPDFSQVEADVAQLETNRRFALFFPETRPFFLEGADIFGSPTNLIFTRTVVDPVAGMKLSGKAGSNALGLFLTRDEVNNLVFPANQGSRGVLLDDQEVNAGVARIRHDIGASSSLGALATGRVAEDYHNWVAGVDGSIQLDRSTTLVFQYARSETKYPDSVASDFGQRTGSFGGDLARLSLFHRSRDWFVLANLQDLGRDFRADAGFVPRVDTRGGTFDVGRTWRGQPGDFFSQLQFSAGVDYFEDHDGRTTDRSGSATATYRGPLQSMVQLRFGLDDRLFADEVFSLHQTSLLTTLQPSGALTLGLMGVVGENIDFTNVREADLVRIAPSLTWRAGRRVNLNLSHAFERLSLDGERIFHTNLSQVRLLYHISVEAFVRATVQYRDVDRNLDLYSAPVEESTQTLFTQFLFSLKLNPRTVAFVGYSDNRLGLTEFDLTQTDRTFFVKLGYAWRP
jgi:hypothetical protein